MSAAIERLVNLALFLASAREPVSTERVRSEVLGYPETQDYDTFERMFERDKESLREAGLVITSTPDGRNLLDTASTFATSLTLSREETVAMRTVATALLGDPGFPFAEDLRFALTKIAALDISPSPASSRLADEDPASQGERVATLSAAASSRKRVAFEYVNSAGERRAREIEPYGLFLREGRWYVVGRDAATDEMRVFAVARIDKLTPNTARPKSPDFERLDGFDVRSFIGLPFQYGHGEPFEATLAFSSAAAWRARALTFGVGTLEVADGADTRLHWKITARDRRRLLRWTIANGPGIEILSPPALAEELSAGLEEVAEAHG
ncbi:MAG: WYL domain-containing protein [Clostridiales bacterium]|nr:WYL domain-containing protein [Clostridiales bacterium]